jgi:galactose mutarotase-like enzyme
MMSLFTIRNDMLTVVISAQGAELQSIRDRNGVERLWQGDPEFWSGRAPILFPVAGGFRGDAYEMDGKRYPMPKHGFVRKLEWRVESAEETALTLLTNETHEGFPFAYELRVRFVLEESSLLVTYETANLDSRAFYFSVGAHEAYATPEGIEAYSIVFDEAETLQNFVLEGNLIKRQPVVMAENTRELPLLYKYFTVDALVFRTLKSRGVTLRSRLHDRELRVDFPEHDTLMFWTKPNAGYICIEPWCNAPDFVDADCRIDHKPGFIRLMPGNTVARRHTITIR